MPYRKQRADSVSREMDKNIRDFYLSNSRVSPNKRDANFGKRKNKEGQSKQFLQCSIMELYKQWCGKQTRAGLQTVSYNEFAKRRPSHVCVISRHDRIECACQKDVNMKMMVNALARFRSKQRRVTFIHDMSTHLSDLVAECTCAPHNGSDAADFLETDIHCINGKCNRCGTQAMDKYVQVCT